MAKIPLHWSENPSAETNERVYDSASVDYDSASLNYDGVVDADLADTEKLPTEWSDA
jgi:hypothetical protein